jgi:hypothetical protein
VRGAEDVRVRRDLDRDEAVRRRENDAGVRRRRARRRGSGVRILPRNARARARRDDRDRGESRAFEVRDACVRRSAAWQGLTRSRAASASAHARGCQEKSASASSKCERKNRADAAQADRERFRFRSANVAVVGGSERATHKARLEVAPECGRGGGYDCGVSSRVREAEQVREERAMTRAEAGGCEDGNRHPQQPHGRASAPAPRRRARRSGSAPYRSLTAGRARGPSRTAAFPEC